MRIGTPGFIPARLTEAREARRIATKSALARRLGVSPTSVSRWEDLGADQSPDYSTLVRVAGELGVRPEFFLRPPYHSERPTFLRSLASTLVRDLAYQKAQMHWLQEVSFVLGHYVDLPEIDIPDVLDGATYGELRDEDIEDIALRLRQHWNMGEGPCGDVVVLMERIGIVVATIPMGTTKLDGLCSWSPVDGRPHVLLATDKMSFPRRQMDAAHELAHVVLHHQVPEEEFQDNLRMIERQAFRLASALLMPSTTYPHEVKYPSLAMLTNLKERWRVSIKAQIKRLSDLEIIPEEYTRQLYKLYSAKGWSKGEPLDHNWPIVAPKALRDSLNLIVEHGVRGKADLLATEFTISASDVESLCSLPSGWFDREPAEVVSLKIRTGSSAADLSPKGEIIPFPDRE
ncbi:ImmA/IrrE family metallo-endopeptidase [Gluconobacter sp. LMG 1744]|uniref:helix-turn-helix domain-containing protein n=1 Tax=Gluconobacter TaxID=441 RepID=UPI0009BC83A8|nr:MULTISPECIES: XRE family transcriptional regulator [Gluconobacter]AQS92477.1 DNA-binding protein [Gluconobacter albidus]MBF0891794.1 ImmA/IrrE family metallo-endopeptidase [Gluconobacter cadivus]MBS1092660.1 ImmA/IrrE family metallo-endopeptidase [Gluconobacter sp. Dm-74]